MYELEHDIVANSRHLKIKNKKNKEFQGTTRYYFVAQSQKKERKKLKFFYV